MVPARRPRVRSRSPPTTRWRDVLRAQGRRAAPLLADAPHLAREGAPQPPPRHPAAAGEGGRELRVADGREVGREEARLRRDPAPRRGGLRRRGPRPRTSSSWTATGTLRTPPEETVLLGVTRRSVLEIAKHDGRKVIEERVPPRGALRGGRGVPHRHDAPACGRSRRWTTARIGAGAPGPVTQRARASASATSRRARTAPSSHWLTFVNEA